MVCLWKTCGKLVENLWKTYELSPTLESNKVPTIKPGPDCISAYTACEANAALALRLPVPCVRKPIITRLPRLWQSWQVAQVAVSDL